MGLGIFLLTSGTVEAKLTELIAMEVPTEIIRTAAIIMIAIGSFVFFVGFCGCCGAMRESAIMLGIYIACMVIVMIAELSAGIYVAVEKGNIESSIKDDLGTTVRNYTGVKNSTLDFLQIKFRCCGSENFTDYQNSVWYSEQQEQKSPVSIHVVPRTCCAGSEHNKIFTPSNYSACNLEARILKDSYDQLYPKGCHRSLMDWLDDQSWTLIGVVLGIGVIEIFGIALAGWLCRNRTEYYD